MSISRRKGDAGLADALFSRIVRSRGVCERCGYTSGPFDTAHVIRRRWSATRTDELAAWCLCRPCHRRIDEWACDFLDLVDRTIGRETYEALKRKANDPARKFGRVFWRDEVERLRARCRELGLSERRAA